MTDAVEDLNPDWGLIEIRDDPEHPERGLCLNPAGVLESARVGTTPQARSFYRAACRHWRTIRDMPGLSEDDRQALCIERAFAEINVTVRTVDLPQEN